MTANPARPDRPPGEISPRLFGIILFVLGIFCMSVMDAAAKWLVASYATVQIIFFDSVFSLIPLSVTLSKDGVRSLWSKKWLLMIGRGLITLAAIFFFFTALRYMPLADVVIITLIAPLLTVFLSAVIFKEKLERAQVLAIFTGLAGAAMIIHPSGVRMEPVLLLPLAAGGCVAFGLVASKYLVRTETPSAISAYEVAVLLCASSAMLPHYWVKPAVGDLPVVAVMGIMSGLCVYLRSRACIHAPLSTLAAFEYTGLIWAIIFGFLIWSELPDVWGWIGAALIVGSGLYVIRRRRGQT